MNNMDTIFFIIWCLLGLISVWRTYHGALKDWWNFSSESYWDFHKRNGGSALINLLLFSPIFVIGGPISLILFEFISKDNCWFFTTKNKKS